MAGPSGSETDRARRALAVAAVAWIALVVLAFAKERVLESSTVQRLLAGLAW